MKMYWHSVQVVRQKGRLHDSALQRHRSISGRACLLLKHLKPLQDQSLRHKGTMTDHILHITYITYVWLETIIGRTSSADPGAGIRLNKASIWISWPICQHQWTTHCPKVFHHHVFCDKHNCKPKEPGTQATQMNQKTIKLVHRCKMPLCAITILFAQCISPTTSIILRKRCSGWTTGPTSHQSFGHTLPMSLRWLSPSPNIVT